MKVWVVEECFPYEGCAFEAVFSSKELAEQYIAKQRHPNDWNIHEAEVDKPED